MDIIPISKIMPKIYIDADGCPVVYQTLDIADEFNVPCCIVCDHAHQFNIEDVEIIMVDQGSDSADYKILNLLHQGDIVITQDYGLATLVLSKKAYPISQNGILYTDDNIESMLSQRHFSAKQRKATHRYPHISKRTKQQDDAFMESLRKLLKSIM